MLVVYDANLSGYHEIKPISYATEEWENDIGKFTLIVAPSAYNIAFLKKGAFLYRTGIKQAMIITRVNPDTSQTRITVNGYTTNRMLNKRSIVTPVAIETVEEGIYEAITDNLRDLPDIQIAELKGLPEMHSALLHGGQLLDKSIEILSAVELGHHMLFDTKAKKHIFEIYKGRDLTTGSKAVIFSEERGTARDLKIEDDESNFANVCYVTGALSDGSQVMRTVGEATGADRFEYWHDSRLKQDSEETEEEFFLRLDGAGAVELAKRVRNIGFSVRVDPGEYGKAYTMGDRVKCVAKRFGVAFTARIKGVKRTLQAQSESVNIILGEPQLTVIGEMKLWLK